MRGWWWLWARCPGLGAVRIAALRGLAVAQGVGPDELWRWPIERLRQELTWPRSCADGVERYRRLKGERPDLAVPSDALLPGDLHWPESLNRLHRSPPVLHHRGRQDLWGLLQRRQAVAIVGTRSASEHGLAMADELGQALAAAGWPVLSGLAEGIDAAAHRGCLAVNGAPVAVLGTPLDRVYPAHHKPLQMAVGRRGLLLSEHAPGSAVKPGHFAARNRLLVLFAKALVIVECPERSGALISAAFAAEQQCPVWAVPGDARRWSCRGSNALLEDQAAPLLRTEKLLHQLGAGPLIARQGRPQQALLEAIGDGASINELTDRLRMTPGQLATQLLEMEQSGHLQCDSGVVWKRRSP